MTRDDDSAERHMKTVELIALLLPNEFLFCLFSVINYWRQPISLKKLAKELRAEESLLQDHLSLLIKCGALLKSGEKYSLSDIGNEGMLYLYEALGEVKPVFLGSWIASTNLYSEVVSSPISAVPSINVVHAQTNLEGKKMGELEEEKTSALTETNTVIPPQVVAANAE